MILEKALTKDQISLANDIHRRMSAWCVSESSLDFLAQRFPEFTPETTLIKAVLVNSLYGTNVWDIVRVAEYVQGILTPDTLINADIDLVERMAHVPKGPNEKKPKRRYSFAAKFAHFFINSEQYPILDTLAEEMVKWHLGRQAMVYNDEQRYVSFVRNFNYLRESIEGSHSLRELDRYLWIAGHYHNWKKNAEVPMYGELRSYFENNFADLDRVFCV